MRLRVEADHRVEPVDILLAALDEIDQFDRQVLVLRDRDELPADAIARLEAKQVVTLLSRRELENFLLDVGAVYGALCARAEEIGSSTEEPESQQEVADKMKAAADSLQSVAVLKRVVADLPTPRLVGRADIVRLSDSPDPPEALVELVKSKVKPPEELERVIREGWARAAQGVDADWERTWPEIAPGADVLARVWEEYGARYDKARDGVMIAQRLPAPDEVKDVMRQFLGESLVP